MYKINISKMKIPTITLNTQTQGHSLKLQKTAQEGMARMDEVRREAQAKIRVMAERFRQVQYRTSAQLRAAAVVWRTKMHTPKATCGVNPLQLAEITGTTAEVAVHHSSQIKELQAKAARQENSFCNAP